MNLRSVLKLAALTLPVLMNGCTTSSDVAGTSSGVDNPQIIVAFTSSTGTPKVTSASLSIYSADQNPTTDPDPILKTRVESATSIQLSRTDFIRSGDSTGVQYFNVLVIGDDSTGGLLQQLAYNPVTKKFLSNGTVISKTTLPQSSLVPYSSSLDRANQSSPERVFIPGTPFQSVVVDSGFSFAQIPPGTFPLHLITNKGVELPLPDSLNTHLNGPHRVDTNAPPVDRPPPPPAPSNLKAIAGPDQNVFMGSQTFLSGLVMGVDPDDPRLAILWRQISPDPKTLRANIANASELKTPVSFPKAGAYRFTLTIVYGNDTLGKSQDTVSIGVQPSTQPAFVQPSPGDTVYIGRSYEIVWNVPKTDTLTLQLSTNGGTTWISPAIATGIIAQPGKLNSYFWTPSTALSPSTNCAVRFVNTTDTLVSPKFGLKSPPPASGNGLPVHPR